MPDESRSLTHDLIFFALIALFVVVPIRWFVAQPFIVRGASMEPNFHTGDYLVVDQLSYHFHEPERGDVIIMKYPKDESVYFVKRIIGLPNETVEIEGSRIIIRRGVDVPPITLDEPYTAAHKDEYGTYALGPDEYFVMGDNRDQSSDSRVWGTLPRTDIVGRAFFRLFPVTKIEYLPGSLTHTKI